MSEIYFWKNWRRSHKWLLAIAALTVAFSLAAAMIAWGFYPALVFDEVAYQEIIPQIFHYRDTTIGAFQLELPAENNVLFEHLGGDLPRYRPIVFYLFLIVFALGISTMLSIATSLKRLWFIAAAGLFILLAAALRIEALSILGLTNKIPLVIFLTIYLVPAFCLHRFAPRASFLTRWICFVALTAIVAIVIALTAKTPNWGLTLASYSLMPGMLICLLFILLIGHEFVVFFVSYVQAVEQANQLKHTFVLTGVYILYLLIAYLQQEGYLAWGIWTPDMIWIFLIAGLFGCWNYRRREPLYENYFSANPEGVVIYLSLFAISAACFGFCYGAGNDAGADFMSRWTLYAQLGCSIIFGIYLISNFSPLLWQNISLQKILYKPNTMSWFTFRVMSGMAIYAFLSYDVSWTQFMNQGIGAYYNNIATAYYIQADYGTAAAYYEHAAHFRRLNHQAHYALATLYARQSDMPKEKAEYALATLPQFPYPSTEAAFLNASDAHARHGNIDEGIRSLKSGLRKMPNSGKLYNAMGILYKEKNNNDSAIYCFDMARNQRQTRLIASANLTGMSAWIRSNFPADSLWSLLKADNEGSQANALAVGNFQRQILPIELPVPRDSVLTARQAALYANYLINDTQKPDTALLNRLSRLIALPRNEQFAKKMTLSLAHAYYEQGYTRKAIALLRKIAYLTGSGFYNKILGVWALEKKNPQGAIAYFEKAANDEQENAARIKSYLALAQMERGDFNAAEALLKEPRLLPFAETLSRVLRVTEKTILQVSDEDKYAFLRYRSHRYDTTVFWRVWQSLSSEEWKARALADKAYRRLELGQCQQAAFALQRTQGLAFSDKNLFDEIQYLNLRIVALNKNWDALRKAIAEKKFEGQYRTHKLFYEALLLQADKKPQEADKKFAALIEDDLTDGTMTSIATEALFAANTSVSSAYETLAEALLQQPHSVPLLKQYVLASIKTGIESEAAEALERLKSVLPLAEYKRYIEAHPKEFSIAK